MKNKIIGLLPFLSLFSPSPVYAQAFRRFGNGLYPRNGTMPNVNNQFGNWVWFFLAYRIALSLLILVILILIAVFLFKHIQLLEKEKDGKKK